MLPPISSIVGIEMIRDGGSLAAEFAGINGSKYCLHFKLISKNGPSGFVRLGYERPVVFERIETREENRFEWHSINEVEVSWAHAKALLHQLRALLRSEQDSEWLAAMEEVAVTEGQLPKGIPHVLEPGRSLLRDA